MMSDRPEEFVQFSLSKEQKLSIEKYWHRQRNEAIRNGIIIGIGIMGLIVVVALYQFMISYNQSYPGQPISLWGEIYVITIQGIIAIIIGAAVEFYSRSKFQRELY